MDEKPSLRDLTDDQIRDFMKWVVDAQEYEPLSESAAAIVDMLIGEQLRRHNASEK